MKRSWLRLLGATRAFYWRRLRTRTAYARHVQRAELRWSGKRLHPDDLAEWVDELKGPLYEPCERCRTPVRLRRPQPGPEERRGMPPGLVWDERPRQLSPDATVIDWHSPKRCAQALAQRHGFLGQLVRALARRGPAFRPTTDRRLWRRWRVHKR